MAIEFNCPHCTGLLRTQDDKAGLKAKCPKCAQVVTVPSPEHDFLDTPSEDQASFPYLPPESEDEYSEGLPSTSHENSDRVSVRSSQHDSPPPSTGFDRIWGSAQEFQGRAHEKEIPPKARSSRGGTSSERSLFEDGEQTAARQKHCPMCGETNDARARQCISCGERLMPGHEPQPNRGIRTRQEGMLPAELTERFIAFFLDLMLLGVIFQILSFGLAIAMMAIQLGPDGPELWLIMLPSCGLVAWIYYASMESSGNQGTLGKMAMHIKVTDLEGKPISFAQATGRYFGLLLSTTLFLLGFVVAGFTEKRQTLHDLMSGCLVIKK